MSSENRGSNKPEHRNFPDDIKIDAPFSNLVIDDDHVYLSGLVAADVEEGLPVLGNIQAKTEVIMKTIKFLLGQVDLDLSDILRRDVQLTDLDNIGAINAVYRGYFNGRLSSPDDHAIRSAFWRSRLPAWHGGEKINCRNPDH